MWDVAVDLRKESSTYGMWEGVYLSSENKRQFYVPEGFAHGFLVISDIAIFNYKCTNLYHPEYDSGILWNDKSINIQWPLDKVDKFLKDPKKEKEHVNMTVYAFKIFVHSVFRFSLFSRN